MSIDKDPFLGVRIENATFVEATLEKESLAK
jgi:hypothetical protein